MTAGRAAALARDRRRVRRACGALVTAVRPRGRRAGERGGQAGERGRAGRWTGPGRERGVASLEYLGMLPFLLLVALAGIQLGIAAYCGEQAGTAARTAARTAAQHAPHADPGQAGVDAVSGWVHPEITFPYQNDTTVRATATVTVPSVIPGVHLFGPLSRSATMPKEDATTSTGTDTATDSTGAAGTAADARTTGTTADAGAAGAAAGGTTGAAAGGTTSGTDGGATP